jgi:hypothetical protein
MEASPSAVPFPKVYTRLTAAGAAAAGGSETALADTRRAPCLLAVDERTCVYAQARPTEVCKWNQLIRESE